MSLRGEKISNNLQKLAAEFLERNSNRTSLITVTNVMLKNRNREALIFITVLPQNQEKAALDFSNRQKRDFYKFVKEKSKIGIIPKVHFKIDEGEKNRQRIDFLIQND